MDHANASGADPTNLTISDNRGVDIWFTEPRGNRIGRVIHGKIVQEFKLPKSDSYPLGIEVDGNGGAWFTEYTGNRIGHIDDSGKIVEYSVPTKNSGPFGIKMGFDLGRTLWWFTERNGNKVGQIDDSGTIHEYGLPHAGSRPTQLVSSFGNPSSAWIAGSGSGYVDIVTLEGSISEQLVSGHPSMIVVGDNETFWYIDPTQLTIGYIWINPNNDIEEHLQNISSVGDMSYCLFDQSIWLTDPKSREIDDISIYTQYYT